MRQLTKIKNALSELRFCRDVLEDTEALLEEYDIELNFVLNAITNLSYSPVAPAPSGFTGVAVYDPSHVSHQVEKKKNFSASDKTSESTSSNELIEERDNPNTPPWMKKLFKKIAFECHPDRLLNRKDLSAGEKFQREEFYQIAAKAYEEIDKVSLLEVGIYLQLSVDLSWDEQKKILVEGIVKVQEKIKKSHELVAWSWGESEGNIPIRTRIVIYVRNYLKMPLVDKNAIEQFIINFENGDDLTKQRFEDFQQNTKRQPGTHPGPSLSSIRKQRANR